MAMYTVHESPRSGEARRAESFKFVRDGFHWWAFLLAPLWMVWHGLWLVFVATVVLVGLLNWGLARLGVSDGALFFVNILVLLLIGLEASTLRRWTLSRWKWRLIDVVSADTMEGAERRFFDKRSAAERNVQTIVAPVEPPQASVQRRAEAGSGVVGLFPEPGSRT